MFISKAERTTEAKFVPKNDMHVNSALQNGDDGQTLGGNSLVRFSRVGLVGFVH